jgi:hypothetical protein
MTTQELTDRVEIDHVLKMYYRGVDREDFEGIRACFAPGAPVDFVPWYEGDRDGFIDFLNSRAGLLDFTRTMHFAGNTIIELAGDTAFSEVYAMAQHTTSEEHPWAGSFVTTWLRYVDRLERTESGWLIAHRRVACEWIRRDDAGGWEESPSPGRRDKTDIVYLNAAGANGPKTTA